MFSAFQLQLLSVVAIQLSASLSVFHLTQTQFRDHRAVASAPRVVRSFADDVDPWFNWGDDDTWGVKQPSVRHHDAKKQGSENRQKQGDGRDPSLITKGIKFISKLEELPDSMKDKFYHPELSAQGRKDKYRLSEDYRTPRSGKSVNANSLYFDKLNHKQVVNTLISFRNDNKMTHLELESLRPFFPYSNYKKDCCY